MTAGYTKAADGVRIAWRDEGPRDAPAILFCTMATAALGVWDSVAAPLAREWRVIRHDRRGDGDSDPGEEASHSFATYAADAVAVLDALGCAAATVCGMAFGARVAVHMARDVPERVAGLVLFDATGAAPAPEAERRAGSQEAARLRAQAGVASVPVDRAWFHRRDPAGAGFQRHAFKDLPQWTPGLERIRAPTLVACGEQDPNLAGARRLAQTIAGGSFALMPMTGHGSILDRPDLVLSLLQGFLGRPALVEGARGDPS
jgi:pimeloyl-ACP methyl ester carboxylesterase